MSEPPRIPQDDHLPPSASADPPLSLDARTPGPRGLAPKIGLAALGLLILFAVVAALWVALHHSRRGQLQRPPAVIEAR